MTTDNLDDESFTLYDLRVEVVADDGPVVTHAKAGESFDVIGGRIVFSGEPSFSLYGMMAVLPFLPAKQRESEDADWMTTDEEIASPDPRCTARFRIRRLAKKTYRHSDFSAVPLAVPDEP